MQETPLATGRTADVYPWPGQRVIKLYHAWVLDDDIAAEQAKTKAVRAAGLPVPAPGDIVLYAGRRGLTFERVDGRSLAAELMARPHDVIELAQQFAALQATVHGLPAPAAFPPLIPRLIERIGRCAELAHAERARLIDQLDALPRGDRIYHGDLHPENVILAAEGAIVIDWIDACAGPALADVARTCVLLCAYAATAAQPDPVRQFVRTFHDAWIAHYLTLTGASRADIAPWIPLIAAARCTENIPGQGPWLASVARGDLGVV
jgi:Ser/Thr protein kinase RdoA (MazF antagonist)